MVAIQSWYLTIADEVFKMRQEKAAMLKVHIERAEKLSESELGDLRADVKVRHCAYILWSFGVASFIVLCTAWFTAVPCKYGFSGSKIFVERIPQRQLLWWTLGPVIKFISSVGCLSSHQHCSVSQGWICSEQWYVLPSWDRSCRSNFLSHTITVYWQQASQS